MNRPSDIGALIRAKRVQAAMSGGELARLSGRTYSCINKVERGVYQPTDVTLAKIAKALGCTMTELLAPIDVEHTPAA